MEESLTFKMCYSGSGSLPSHFTIYSITEVTMHYRMDYISLIKAIGPSLEIINFRASQSKREQEELRKRLASVIAES